MCASWKISSPAETQIYSRHPTFSEMRKQEKGRAAITDSLSIQFVGSIWYDDDQSAVLEPFTISIFGR
jgi:hypothetical protein